MVINMKTKTLYIAHIPGVKTLSFDSYEKAWKYSERVYQETGRVALIEKVN